MPQSLFFLVPWTALSFRLSPAEPINPRCGKKQFHQSEGYMMASFFNKLALLLPVAFYVIFWICKRHDEKPGPSIPWLLVFYVVFIVLVICLLLTDCASYFQRTFNH